MKKVEIVDIVPEKKSETQVETVTESEDTESNSKNSEDESSTSTQVLVFPSVLAHEDVVCTTVFKSRKGSLIEHQTRQYGLPSNSDT